MGLSKDPFCRLARLVFTALMVLSWSGGVCAAQAPAPAAAAPDPAKSLEQFDQFIGAVEAASRDLPRETFDVTAVVESAGREPAKLFEWVRDRTAWAPYRGLLRGSTGVLMDRTGSSLDRAVLLAELLSAAGHEARLARGTIAQPKARELAARVRTVPPPVPAEAGPDVSERVRAAANAYSLPPGVLDSAFARSQLGAAKLLEQLARRAAEQTPALLESAGAGAGPGNRAAADLADVLVDHWWVQHKDGAAWVDLDPLTTDAAPGTAAATPSATFPKGETGFAVPDDQRHAVSVRLVIETTKGGKLAETTVFDQTILPPDVFGQRVVLTHWPLNWPAENKEFADLGERLRAVTTDQHEWMPVMRIGSRQIIQSSFGDTGAIDRKPNPNPFARMGKSIGRAASVFDALDAPPPGGAAAGPGQLTAEWVEYEVRSPGEKPRVHRRQVFDLVGPAARAGARNGALTVPPPTDAQRVERGLALIGGFEVLVTPCRMSGDFVAAITLKTVLANRPAARSLLEPAAGDSAAARKKALNVVQSLEPMPGPLYDLAVLRHAAGGGADDLTYTHANVLTCRWAPRVELAAAPGEQVKLCHGFDIVENGLTPRPGSKAAAGAFAARVEQGVVDTNAESLLVSRCATVVSTAEMFDLRDAGGEWVTVRGPGEAKWKAARVPADVRARVDRDVAAGFVVVVPTAPVALAGGEAVGWWRIDPATGQTLGMGDAGGGATMAEYASLISSILLCGGIALLDGKLSAQDAIVCAALGGGGAAMAGMWSAAGMGVGARIGLILAEAATGIWLNQSPALQNGIP